MTKDALRAGSAEAKAYVGKYESHHGQDALRAGSAEAKLPLFHILVFF